MGQLSISSQFEKTLFRERYLFIFGPTKTGTTSLYRAISQHPKIVSGYKKELNYFREDRSNCSEKKYLKYFKKRDGDKLVYFDASPMYFYNESFYDNIKKIEFSEAKGIVVIRNPYERLRSLYYFRVQRGVLEGKRSDLNDFLKRELEKSKTMYIEKINFLRSKFGEKNVFCFNFEDLVSKQESLVNYVFKELGLQPFLINYKHGNKTVYKRENKIYFYFKAKFYHPFSRFVEKKVSSIFLKKILLLFVFFVDRVFYYVFKMKRDKKTSGSKKDSSFLCEEDFRQYTNNHYDKELDLLENYVVKL